MTSAILTKAVYVTPRYLVLVVSFVLLVTMSLTVARQLFFSAAGLDANELRDQKMVQWGFRLRDCWGKDYDMPWSCNEHLRRGY